MCVDITGAFSHRACFHLCGSSQGKCDKPCAGKAEVWPLWKTSGVFYKQRKTRKQPFVNPDGAKLIPPFGHEPTFVKT